MGMYSIQNIYEYEKNVDEIFFEEIVLFIRL